MSRFKEFLLLVSVITVFAGGVEAARRIIGDSVTVDQGGIPTTGQLGEIRFDNSDVKLKHYASTWSEIPTLWNDKLESKGDLIVRGAASTLILSVGGNDQVLTADSAETTGTKWATPAAALNQSYELSNLGLTTSVAANALTIALKTKAGTDPTSSDTIKIGTRNSTATTGTYNQRSVTAATSLVISSGSTMGFLSALTHYLYVYALDFGTIELAASATRYDDYSIQSTSAEGGAGGADSNSTIYSTTARTSVSVRLIGRIKFSLTTAGTWDEAGDEISLTALFIPNVIAAKYTSNDSETYNGSTTTRIDYEDRVYDTHNAVTVTDGSWAFTAPIAGIYHIDAQYTMVAAARTATNQVQSNIVCGGSVVASQAENFDTATSKEVSPNMSTDCNLAAAGTIYVQGWQNDNNTTLNTETDKNWIAIHWVGPGPP